MIKILSEKWPAVVDQLLSSETKKKLANYLRNKGMDIENTDNEVVQISNNRDPRLKSGVIIVKFNDAGSWKKGPSIGVWFDGECIQDVVLGRDNRWNDILASRQSWKNLLNRSDIEVYRMVIDPDTAKAMIDKRKERFNAKKGTQLRYRDYEYPSQYGSGTYTIKKNEFGDTPARYAKLDKSGYKLPSIDKYRDKLAELQISNAENILKDASDMYSKLASQMINRRGERNGFGDDSYRSIIRRIPDLFYDLSDAMAEYDKEKARWGDKLDPRDSYSRSRVMSILKDLREVMKFGEKYIE